MRLLATDRILRGAVLCALAAAFLGGPAEAQTRTARIDFANVTSGQRVAGRVTLSVVYDAVTSLGRVDTLNVYIDGRLLANEPVAPNGPAGIKAFVLDTHLLPTGEEIANGERVIKVVSMVGNKAVAQRSVALVVANGRLDVVPPLVAIKVMANGRRVFDGDTVSGTLEVEVEAQDAGGILIVSAFANRNPIMADSRFPYTTQVDTRRFSDANGRGELILEAMAFDTRDNEGMARPLTLTIEQTRNLTNVQADPVVPDPALTGAAPAAPGQPVRANAPLIGPAVNLPPPLPPADQRAVAPPGVRVPTPDAPPNRVAPLVDPATGPAPRPNAPGVRPETAPGNTAPVIKVQPRTNLPTVARAPQLQGARPRMPGARTVAPVVTPPPPTLPKPIRIEPREPTRTAAVPATGPGRNEAVIIVPRGNEAPGPDGRVAADVFVYDMQKRSHDHRVQRGESLVMIARQYRVTERSILIASGLPDDAKLRPGQKITVPNTFNVVLGGSQVDFDVKPRVEQGISLAPFRRIFEHAGGDVVWYPDNRTVRAARDSVEVKLTIGSREAELNSMVVVLDRAAFIDQGRTLVPFSFMEKALNLTAEYDVRTGSIFLVKK